jgi:hypothetical protein
MDQDKDLFATSGRFGGNVAKDDGFSAAGRQNEENPPDPTSKSAANLGDALLLIWAK